VLGDEAWRPEVLLDEAPVAYAACVLVTGDRDAAAAGSRRRLEGVALLLLSIRPGVVRRCEPSLSGEAKQSLAFEMSSLRRLEAMYHDSGHRRLAFEQIAAADGRYCRAQGVASPRLRAMARNEQVLPVCPLPAGDQK
jgi:hypothetical protein